MAKSFHFKIGQIWMIWPLKSPNVNHATRCRRCNVQLKPRETIKDLKIKFLATL